MAPCILNNPGYLHGRLYGSLAATIDWRGPELTCDGMTRPNNEGIRLIFASPENEDQARLIFVIGIDGELDNLENHEGKGEYHDYRRRQRSILQHRQTGPLLDNDSNS